MVLIDIETERLISEIKDYQLTHGSLLKLVRLEEPSTVPAKPVGVSITPTRFPQKQYAEAVTLQALFSELYIRASCDVRWLSTALGPFLKSDAFLSSLWEIHLQVQSVGVVQPTVCGVFRSDYMLHGNASALKQVEMNTFSVAGPCHAERVAQMHHHIRRVRGAGKDTQHDTGLPHSSNTSSIVGMLSTSHLLYIKSTPKPTCVLMIVQPRNFNIADERPIEYGLWDRDIPCYRCEWQTILNDTTLATDRTLSFRPRTVSTEFEVSVIYYRAGYEAAEYNDIGKQARLRLEVSKSIKCPDILTHLTTFKAIQQAFTQPGAVEHFLSPEEASKVRSTFMEMQILSSSSPEVYKLALDPFTARDFVLKPNLEGGGHNVYRHHISSFLKCVPERDWDKYILMRLIKPPPTQGLLMMPVEIYSGPVVSELGILGACIWRREVGKVEILQNSVGGWTFKTKKAGVDEMSVVKGYGCFDCPALIEG